MAPDGIVFNIKFTGDSKNAVESARRVVEAINGAGAAAKDLAKKAQGELGGAGGSVSYTQAAKGVGSVTASTTLQSTEQAAENARRASSKAFNEIQHNFNATMNAATRMVNGLRQVFQGLQELGFYLSTFVTAPLVLLFRNGFDMASSFEQQMAKVKKAVELPGDATKGYAELEQRLRNLAKVTPTSAEQLGVFAEQAGQLGVEGIPAVMRFVQLVNKLSVGTDVAADSIAEQLGRIATAFGMDLNTEEGITQLEKLSSVLDFVAKKTSTNVDGMITAMEDAASVGPLLKIPAKDVAVMAGMLITSGQDASAAGTILTQFFVQTLKNSEKFAGAMTGYARTVKDANGNIIDSFQPYADGAAVIKEINTNPVQVLKDALDMLNTATDEDKAQALKNYFDAIGFRGGRTASMAAGLGKMDELLKAANEEFDHGTTLQDDYNTMLETSASAVQIFKNNINDLGITLGSYIMPMVNEAIQMTLPIIQDLAKGFANLDSRTKLLIVGIPVLLAILGPLLFFLSMLGHVIGLVASGFVSAFMGMGQAAFAFIKVFQGLKGAVGVAGVLQAAVTKIGVAFGMVAAPAEGAAVAIGGLAQVLTTVFSAAAWIVGIPLAIVGILKLLSRFGLDVSTFFNNMAKSARRWGENLIATYGNGMLGGAARFLSKVVTTIAGWIARFFESHSPPEEGPLSGIDQWGTNLMNTYLKGFLLADFDILSEVAGYIEQAFEDISALQGLDLSNFTDAFIKVREQISQLISVFNTTGQISESILSGIGSNLGSLGKDIQELLRRWLQYKQLQEQIAAIENRKKEITKTYDAQIAAISKMTNLTAEQKAELIRAAQLKRDADTKAADEEEKALQEKADAAKDALDWQKEYVKAQLDILDLLKKQNEEKKKSSDGGSDQMEPVDFNPGASPFGSGGTPVLDPGDEINKWTEKIQNARSAWDEFMRALNGEAFGGGMSKEDKDLWAQTDPAGYKTAKDMYDVGTKLKGVWDAVKGPVEFVGRMLGLVDDKTQLFKKTVDDVGKSASNIGQNPVVQFFQKIWDSLVGLITIGPSFTTAFGQINDALERAKKTLEESGVNWAGFIDILKILGAAILGVVGLVVGILGFLIVEIINVAALTIQYLAGIIGDVIAFGAQVIAGLSGILGGLWDIIAGIFTLNGARIINGIKELLMGLWNFAQGMSSMMMSIVLNILAWLLSSVVRIIGDLIAWFANLAGNPTLANSVRQWVDNAVKNIQAFVDSWRTKLDEATNIIKGWLDKVSSWLSTTFHINLSGTVNGGAQQNAAGGVTRSGKPVLSWVGEGSEQEAIIPLSQLPNVFSGLYGQAFAGAGAGGGVYQFDIHDVTVRDDKDIDRIADAVVRKISKKTNNTSRMG